MRVIKNRVLRRICGRKRYEVREEWRKLHNERVNDLYSPTKIFRVIRLRRMRWEEHVERMGENSDVYRVLVGNPETENLGDSDVDEWIILGWICRRWDVGIWTGLGWPRIETGGGRL